MLTFPTYRGMNGLGVYSNPDGSPMTVLQSWDRLTEAEKVAAWDGMTVEERALVPAPKVPSKNSGCSWYQKPREGTVAANDTTSYCVFDPIRAFQAPALALLSPLSVLGFGGSHNALTDSLAAPLDEANHGKLNPLVALLAAAIWGGAGYVLYSMTKGGN